MPHSNNLGSSTWEPSIQTQSHPDIFRPISAGGWSLHGSARRVPALHDRCPNPGGEAYGSEPGPCFEGLCDGGGRGEARSGAEHSQGFEVR
jgi:hypothetical protein